MEPCATETEEAVNLSPPVARVSGRAEWLRQYWTNVAVVVLAVLLWLPRFSGPLDLRWDAGVYYLLGTSLAAGHGYRIESEPGSPQALQYPPLLPAVVAVYQKVLGTTDPAIVAQWLRISYALLFVMYALAALALAKQFLSPGLAVITVALCLFHHQSIFLGDLLFTELPFALVAIAFVLVSRFRSPSNSWWLELLSFALATAGFLLRTVGLALLVAWVLEGFARRNWRIAFARAAVALIPVVAWQSYVSHVRGSDDYAHPAYSYQRAPYQYYNVSYTENAFLVDPFKPELGHLTARTLASRLTANSIQLLESFGEAVSSSRPQWVRLLNGFQHRLFHGVVTPRWFVFVPIYLLSAFVIGGFFVLVRRKNWLVILVLVGSLGLLLTTPWPAQFLRYLAPLLIFLDLCFVLGLCGFVRWLAARITPGAATFARAAFFAVLIMAFAMEAFTAARLYYFRQRAVAMVFDPESHRPYRLFAHDQTWRAWEKAVNWINTHAPRNAIVATTAPHFCYLLTGLKAVLPPMEADPLKASQLLAAVPVSYVIIDDLEFLNVARRYARPAVESQPTEWRLVQSEGKTKVYERISPRPPE